VLQKSQQENAYKKIIKDLAEEKKKVFALELGLSAGILLFLILISFYIFLKKKRQQTK